MPASAPSFITTSQYATLHHPCHQIYTTCYTELRLTASSQDLHQSRAPPQHAKLVPANKLNARTLLNISTDRDITRFPEMPDRTLRLLVAAQCGVSQCSLHHSRVHHITEIARQSCPALSQYGDVCDAWKRSEIAPRSGRLQMREGWRCSAKHGPGVEVSAGGDSHVSVPSFGKVKCESTHKEHVGGIASRR